MASKSRAILLVAIGTTGGAVTYSISNAFDFANFSLAKLVGAIVVGIVVSFVSSGFNKH